MNVFQIRTFLNPFSGFEVLKSGGPVVLLKFMQFAHVRQLLQLQFRQSDENLINPSMQKQIKTIEIDIFF